MASKEKFAFAFLLNQCELPLHYRSIEAAASHEAKRVEQAAQGQLDRQKLQNEIEAEKERAKVSSSTNSCSICFSLTFRILQQIKIHTRLKSLD